MNPNRPPLGQENKASRHYLRGAVKKGLHPIKKSRLKGPRGWSDHDFMVRLRLLFMGDEVELEGWKNRLALKLVRESLIKGKSIVIKCDPDENLRARWTHIDNWLRANKKKYPQLEEVHIATDSDARAIICYYPNW